MGKEHNKLCLCHFCLSTHLSLEMKEAFCAPFSHSYQGAISI